MTATMDGGPMDGGADEAPAASGVHGRRDARERPRRGLALLLALSAGWGALFSYSIAYLSDERPARPPSQSEKSASANDDPAVLQVASELAARVAPAAAPSPAPPRAEQPEAGVAGPRLVSLRTDLPSQGKPSAETAAPAPVQSLGERAEFVGTWGPTGAACGARSRRRGYIPATITPEGAKAGRTICSFRDGHRFGNVWQMAADCSERGRRWSSQVRLVVEGDRLTWTSGKGASSYVRCGRKAG